MGLFDMWPYTNFHELNLSWLLRKMKELNSTVEDFISLNTIKYANPLQWNITRQYEKNTVVINDENGIAYLSVKPVPSGVSITNDEYWMPIFSLDLISSNKNITTRNDMLHPNATFTSAIGDWLIWNGTLYKVINPISIGQSYVEGANLQRYTVENFIREYIGSIDNLETSDKSNIVNAINELFDEIVSLKAIKMIFKSVSDMSAADNLKVGDVVITTYPYEARWEIIEHETADIINKDLANGLTAHLLNGAPINIGALKQLSQYEDISDIITFLIANGYTSIIVPQGIYKLHVTIPANTTLAGIGRGITSFIPTAAGETVMTLNGDNINISDFSIVDLTAHTSDGISIGSLGCNNSHFKNLHIENCKRGLISNHSMIWNEFINCDFIGCFDSGFVFNGGAGGYFNNNLIESCKFNNNVNTGLYIDCQADKCFGNNIIACNLEYNAIDRFGVATTVTYAAYITGANTFTGCYFEGNTQSESGACIKGVGTQIFNGCSFINERYLVDNALFPAITTVFTFIGCNRYNDYGGIATQDVNDGNIIIIGCNFTIPNSGAANMLNLINNKLINHNITNSIIDGNYQVNRVRSDITGATNLVGGQILYLVNDVNADYTISADLMADGQTLTLNRRSGIAALVNWNGTTHKLVPIH